MVARPADDIELHDVGFHEGSVLGLIAKTYETLLKALVEAIQNAVDANAHTVFVGIDIKARAIIVMDDGEGITKERGQQALRSIGFSLKHGVADALGRFGLGMVALIPMGKVYTISSRPPGAGSANEWTYRSDNILASEKVSIPYSSPLQLPIPTRQFVPTVRVLNREWHTVLRLKGVTQDRVIGLVDLDDLERQILTKLGRAMRRKNTMVHIMLIDRQGHPQHRSVQSGTVTGEALPVRVVEGPDCGRVVFKLYRAPVRQGARRGVVEVLRQGDLAAIGWNDYRVQAMGLKWLREAEMREAFDALGSGYFEGSIEIERVELDPSRDVFVKGQVLEDSYFAVHTWYKNWGQDLWQEERQVRRGQRYVELGERSLRRLMERLDGPEFSSLREILRGRLPEQPRDDTEKPPRERPEPDPDAKPTKRRVMARPPAPRDKPLGAGQGDDAKAPRPGLAFAFEWLPESDRLFEFDPDTGVVTFNTLHTLWIHLDETSGKHLPKHDRQIMRLQEWLGFKVLLLLSQFGREGFDTHRSLIDTEAPYYAAMFCAE